MTAPSESQRLENLTSQFPNTMIGIEICDLTVSATFRWHTRTVFPKNAARDLIVLLLARCGDRLMTNMDRKPCEDFLKAGEVNSALDAICARIEHSQIPIYWNVHASMSYVILPTNGDECNVMLPGITTSSLLALTEPNSVG